jgi:hypothetical protein
MLAHSPPLSHINYNDQGRNITTEDEEGTVLALEQHDFYALSIIIKCCLLDCQFSIRLVNSTLERLLLEHGVHHDYLSSEEHNEVDPTEWRKLLRSFNNVTALRFDAGLVKELSRCL